MALVIMAQPTKTNSNNNVTAAGAAQINSNATNTKQPEDKAKAMFHDFLGMKPAAADSAVVLAAKTRADASPSASASASASFGASSGGGGRGLLSTSSDLASERQVGNHLEGIPFYGPRSDISGLEVSNRLAGSKRSNSDSAFLGSTRDGIPQVGHESLESLHLMKMLKNGSGGERIRRSGDDEVFYGVQAMRPSTGSLLLQSSVGNRSDANASKCEQSIPIGAAVQYPPRGSQCVPFSHQVQANRFKDSNAGPSIISQSAADEGSRTGIKGHGILSSLNAGSGTSEKNSPGMLPSSSKPKSGTHHSELESLTPSSRQGLASASHQMTIFYGGQAHVFDDVHPNKADIIMALAGSNGGSWSTTYSPKPTFMSGSENYITGAEYDAGTAANMAFQRELRGRLSIAGNISQGVGSSDRVSTSTGHHGNIRAKETRNPVQMGEPSAEDKREV